jgi:hypothetical protein
VNDIAFRGAMLGSVLLVSPSDGVSDTVATLATALAPDPGRQAVAADAPDERNDEPFWSALANLLRGRGPVRLAVSGAGGGRSLSRAQWLANRLGTEVVAPDGVVLPVGADMVYVARGAAGSSPGRWISFVPGRSPVPLGPRFPELHWERQMHPERLPPTLDAAVESIPAGLWVHGHTDPPGPRTLRPLLDLPVSSETVTVVLGSPDTTRQEPVEQFTALRQVLPALAGPKVRLVSYGNTPDGPVGQALADRFGERVVTAVGVPTGRDSRAGPVSLYDAAGSRTWTPFAIEMAYYPRRTGGVAEPEVTRYQLPWRDLVPVRTLPGVFEFGAGVLLELVQSGLWLRGVRQRRAPEIRALPADPDWARLTLGVPGEASPDILMSVAATLTSRLEPRLRHFIRVCVAGISDPGTVSPLVTQPSQPNGATRRVDLGLDQPTEILSPVRVPPAAVPVVSSSVARSAAVSASAPTVRIQRVTASGPVPRPVAPAAVVSTTAVTEGGRSAALENAPTTVVPAAVVSAASSGVPVPEPPAMPVGSRVEAMPVIGAMSPTRSGAPGPAQPADAPERPPDARPAESLIPFPPVDPRRRSTPEERVWLHTHLGQSYGLHLSRVLRLIATQPSLRLLADAPGDAVVADLVALCAYLAGGRTEMAEALAAGRIESLLPYVHCVVSGLRRLSSYRGVVFCGGQVGVGAGALLPGAVVTEPAIRQAVWTPSCALGGSTEFVIWSVTARRLESLEPEQRAQRVAFPPGSRFRVLDPGDTAQPTRRVLLRQITAGDARDGLDDGDVAIQDRLTRAVALRDAVPENDRIAPPDADALAWLMAVA